MTRARCLGAASAMALLAAPALALPETVESGGLTLTVETVAAPLEHPWGMAVLPDGSVLVTERNAGTIRRVPAGGELSEPLVTLGDLFRYEGETGRSQAGLFDILLHPDFEENGLVYWSYSRETERGAAVVVQRAEWDGEGFGEAEDVWVMQEADQDSSGLHFGGRMAWGLDGSLYLSIGERRNIERAQDLEDQAGSVLRMTDAGEAPEDNPSWDEDANEFLFTAGNRNIQALTVHPSTGEVWAVDHGPQGGDEINLLVGGNNYGWPWTTGGVDYSGAPIGVGPTMEGMTPPVHIFEETVAPSGLTFVWNEPAFEAWQGDMLVGGLQTGGIVRVTLEEGRVAAEEVIALDRRVRDVAVADGAIWVITDHEDGELVRLVPGGSDS
ncbi:PQQ-dependent sugar dehydrogenase [Rubellimicrobium sp. CFH 75288]|uniref:PQQ-dependent sugar dehydrogenase n=1 Tax=Rubellimicrobium sp. CFH 75288 TaxID=2697034 RepID=UPI001411F44B|nr:PQQ-dependent sugar dehydrogenase [Rubellimicrobium sp. CFH 75288]NAZ36259.1 PQQ-dependent sugar dehydrogenase [Rubellimicrobium sp. CFH 75288]